MVLYRKYSKTEKPKIEIPKASKPCITELIPFEGNLQESRDKRYIQAHFQDCLQRGGLSFKCKYQCFCVYCTFAVYSVYEFIQIMQNTRASARGTLSLNENCLVRYSIFIWMSFHLKKIIDIYQRLMANVPSILLIFCKANHFSFHFFL